MTAFSMLVSPEHDSLVALLRKAREDRSFGEQLGSCETIHEIYVLGKGLITAGEESFAEYLACTGTEGHIIASAEDEQENAPRWQRIMKRHYHYMA